MDFLDDDGTGNRTLYITIAVSIIIIIALVLWVLKIRRDSERYMNIAGVYRNELEKRSQPSPQPVQDEQSENVTKLHYANWCGYCKTMKPIWESVKSQVGDKFRMVEIDEDVAKSAHIKALPTIMKYRKGKAPEKYSGQQDAQTLTQFITS